jgi:hypothetical protein
MKGITVLLIFVMLAGVFGPCILVNAALVPHEDPSAAKSTMDSLSFLTQYAQIFALISTGNYENASQLSKQLSYITVPDDLKYIINKYNELTQQLIAQLDDLEVTMSNASSLLDQYRLVEARQALDHAGVIVAKAQILLWDLKNATSTVSQKLGVLTAAAGSKAQQAYAELQRMLDQLTSLIERYYNLLQATNQGYEKVQSENLKPTSITLTLNATECFVGGYVSASGELTSNDQALANRAVILVLNGAEISTVTTNADGSYHMTIRIPYKYVDSASINAYYAPTDDDRGSYLGSVSPVLRIKVLYYRTTLAAAIPNVAYPGLTLATNGNVSLQNGASLEIRQVKVLLDGVLVSKNLTDINGAFTATSTISSTTKLGTHTLRVTADSSGVYASASLQANLTITKMATFLEVSTPSVVLLPSQIQISGTVRSTSGPSNNVAVLVEFANASASVKTKSDGSFTIKLDIPFSTIFAGNQNLKVVAQPADSWQAIAEENVSILVLNSVSIGLMLAASFSIVLVMYLKFARTKSKKAKIRTVKESAANALAFDKKAPVVVPLPIAERKLEGFEGKVLKSYVESLTVIQSATGYSATPIMTLREYLQLTSPKLGNTVDPFSELTALAEKSLYSIYLTQEEDSIRAGELASTLRRILSIATA